MDSFLKWAGGKRWLVSQTEDLLPPMDTVNNYFEPFLGGGSMFFHLQHTNSILSDTNSDLINAYRVIKENWVELYKILKKYQKVHSEFFYYKIRSSKPRTPLTQAARFIYLNRTCWNGLYRVNQKGEFNVPIGTKTSVILRGDDFEALSNALQQTTLEVCDFEVTINQAEAGDFIFVDPPYTVKHNLNGFVKYNEKIFSWEDQVRLKAATARAVARGANVLVTNADHQSIRNLYQGAGEMIVLNRASVISGNTTGRGIYNELAIKSW